MLKKLWMCGVGALALTTVILPSQVRAQAQKDIPGPIDSLQDLQDTGKMLFKLADMNNDGQISQKEAIDAANLMVGGFFFRADANGDGTLSKEEEKQARDSLLGQKPLLRMILERTKTANNGQVGQKTDQAAQTLANVVDTNNDGKIQASELRQTVQTGIQSLYAAADTNRDGQMSPSEVNAAMAGAAKMMAQASFQKADANGDGFLSREEYDKAIIEPANTVFHIMDTNNDNKISPQEAQTAERIILTQVRRLNVPEPANSPKNLIESGHSPAEVAPVPAFGAPGQRNTPRRAQPAQTSEPAPAAPAPSATEAPQSR